MYIVKLCYVLDPLKCFPHPLSGVNKTHSAFKDVCFTYALSFLQEEIKFDEKMQGSDPEEDNIESVDDVTGSDPDLIQQEVVNNNWLLLIIFLFSYF